MTMGLFTKNPPNTISDKDWDKIRRGANKTEARQGGMFSRKAVERRQTYSRNLARKNEN
jgi:hypothetical protein